MAQPENKGDLKNENTLNEPENEMNSVNSQLSSLEAESFPGTGIRHKSVMRIINLKKVRATGRWNHGHSGKGFTTTWQVNGVRVAKKDLERVISE